MPRVKWRTMAEWANNIANAYPYFSRSSGQNGSTANRIPTTKEEEKKNVEQNLEALRFQNCQLSRAKYFLLSFFAEYFSVNWNNVNWCAFYNDHSQQIFINLSPFPYSTIICLIFSINWSNSGQQQNNVLV